MKVEDTFLIDNIGLILAPLFELPPEGRWENITETITIRTPQGEEIKTEALFSVAHMNIKDPSVSVSKRWPILISLEGVTKKSIPIGSTVFVSKSTKRALTGKNA